MELLSEIEVIKVGGYVKIPLSEAHIIDVEPKFRLISKIPKVTMLLANLLEAKTDGAYRKAATSLRFHLKAEKDSESSYSCLHPDWFGGNEMQVDATTCRLCGYRQHCTLGLDEGDFVEIISLDDSRIPSKKYIQENCFTAFETKGTVIVDPFIGFTSRAKKTRKLYIISQDNFLKNFPGANSIYEFDSTVGYDRRTCQSIWPIDQLFLDVYERISGRMSSEIIDSNNVLENELSIIDQKCLQIIAYENRWLLHADGEDVKKGLDILFSRLIKVLKSRTISPQISNLTLINMSPRIDIPYNCSGSGHLNIAMRWAQLKPNDLEQYREYLELDKRGDQVQKILIDRINQHLFEEISENTIQYLPRFPMIAISPINQFKKIEFEQPAGRIIDVVESKGDRILLLIDSLGFDLLQEVN